MTERFLGNNLDVMGQDYELLPFGSGHRMGPRVIQVSLANLLHGFAWSLPDDMTKEKLNMEEISSGCPRCASSHSRPSSIPTAAC
ncbi:hypothetical protein U9M48_014523 [Paspalum notatum var. saurae]|uniref:Uncharacterized protein n=1 Tax=Paspalum notatum var. saurae TaxID=547442 RepID=A0AAQ3T4F3_PASNO